MPPQGALAIPAWNPKILDKLMGVFCVGQGWVWILL